MATIVVSNIKTVDPGFGFNLSMSDEHGNPINQSLKISVTLTGPNGHTYTTNLYVHNNVTDQSMNIFVPFGDPNYKPGTILKYKVDVYVPMRMRGRKTPTARFRGETFAVSGKMNMRSTLPSSLAHGESLISKDENKDEDGNYMINSVKGDHAGILKSDGNFCVYEKYAAGRGNSIAMTDSSNAPQNATGPFKLSVGSDGTSTRLYVFDGNGNAISASDPSARIPIGASMYIRDGVICLGTDADSAVRVQMGPQWV